MELLTDDNIPNDFFSLINEFKSVKPDRNTLEQFIFNLPSNHYIYILSNAKETISCMTLIIEPKIIHNFGFVCHIEDVIVRKSYHGKGIGSIMLQYAIDVAKNNKCYKIILNCDNNVKQFYIKNGFFESSCQMRLNI